MYAEVALISKTFVAHMTSVRLHSCVRHLVGVEFRSGGKCPLTNFTFPLSFGCVRVGITYVLRNRVKILELFLASSTSEPVFWSVILPWWHNKEIKEITMVQSGIKNHTCFLDLGNAQSQGHILVTEYSEVF